MDKNEFLEIYDLEPQDLKDLGINWVDLYNILQDYKKSIDIYDARLTYVANVLRQHPKIHSVKTRVKDPKRLLQKLVIEGRNTEIILISISKTIRMKLQI